MKQYLIRIARHGLKAFPPLLLAVMLVAGASAYAQENEVSADPLEGLNRVFFVVHEGLDHVLLKPVAQIYEAVLPQPVRTGVDNFFNNIFDLNRSANAFLQGKGERGWNSFGRVLVNTTVGVLGVFDAASELGLEQGDEDFAQTLAVWGVPDGPYLFVPLLGPSTVRNLTGFGVDQYASPLYRKPDVATRNSLTVLRAASARAALLPLDEIIEEATFDKYAYIRSAYFQRRAALLRGDQPPRYDDDFSGEDDALPDDSSLDENSKVLEHKAASLEDQSGISGQNNLVPDESGSFPESPNLASDENAPSDDSPTL